jgi:hypothetical protein
MNRNLFLAVLYYCALVSGRLPAEEPRLDLVNAIRSGAVDYADVFYISRYAQTQIRVDQNKLVDVGKKVRLNHSALVANLETLKLGLMAAGANPDRTIFDLRSGALFYDKSSKLIFTIYLDRFEDVGLIQGEQLRIDRHLGDWFRKVGNSTEK